MKNFLLFIFFIFQIGFIYAQFTEGGSTKDYEQYHYIIDTIRTPIGGKEKQSYFYMSIGLVLPTNKMFNQLPLGSMTIKDSYSGLDGMGGSEGVQLAMGGFHSLRKLNNKLHPVINVGIGQDHSLGFMFYNWNNINTFYSQVSYVPFICFNNSVSPMVSLNPFWKKNNKLHVDVGYKLGINLTFGGGQELSSQDYEIWRDEVLPSFLHGPTIRFRYSKLLVGLDFNFSKENTSDAFYVRSSSGSTYYVDSNVNLSYFCLTLGFNM